MRREENGRDAHRPHTQGRECTHVLIQKHTQTQMETRSCEEAWDDKKTTEGAKRRVPFNSNVWCNKGHFWQLATWTRPFGSSASSSVNGSNSPIWQSRWAELSEPTWSACGLAGRLVVLLGLCVIPGGPLNLREHNSIRPYPRGKIVLYRLSFPSAMSCVCSRSHWKQSPQIFPILEIILVYHKKNQKVWLHF